MWFFWKFLAVYIGISDFFLRVYLAVGGRDIKKSWFESADFNFKDSKSKNRRRYPRILRCENVCIQNRTSTDNYFKNKILSSL